MAHKAFKIFSMGVFSIFLLCGYSVKVSGSFVGRMDSIGYGLVQTEEIEDGGPGLSYIRRQLRAPSDTSSPPMTRASEISSVEDAGNNLEALQQNDPQLRTIPGFERNISLDKMAFKDLSSDSAQTTLAEDSNIAGNMADSLLNSAINGVAGDIGGPVGGAISVLQTAFNPEETAKLDQALSGFITGAGGFAAGLVVSISVDGVEKGIKSGLNALVSDE